MTKHFGTIKPSLWFLSAESVKFWLTSWAVFIALKVCLVFYVHYLQRTHSVLVLFFNTLMICLCLPLIFYSKCFINCIKYSFCKWCCFYLEYLKLLWKFVRECRRGLLRGKALLNFHYLDLSNIADNNHGSVELEEGYFQFIAFQLSNCTSKWQLVRFHSS